MNIPSTFQISTEESRLFAEASGDFNPLHVDPVAARRTQFGHTLIHGVCGTLRAIDHWLNSLPDRQPIELQQLKVKYRQPITQGQAVRLECSDTDSGVRLEIMADNSRCQIIDLVFNTATTSPSPPESLYESAESQNESSLLNIEDCEGLKGSVPLRWNQAQLEILFPHAVNLLPPEQIMALLASTEVVGMHCPGLHSVFAQLSLSFGEETGADQHREMLFSVASADARINRVEIDIDIETSVAKGRIEAFFRAPPAQQAGFKAALDCVDDNVFHGQKAIVIGASRGLGEVITKLLAAGGADIMMTYASGKSDAEAIAQEIGESASTPAISHYDILSGEQDVALQRFSREATHIYYLASPKIEKGDASSWNAELFDNYQQFYLTGFKHIIETALEGRNGTPSLQAFIPSSIFLEDKVKGFAEYIAAKKEAEDYAQSLADQGEIAVAMPRLPRLLTDQTSGVRGLSAEETLEVIAKVLTELPAS
jgi:NADP-dependent 3-hydroxy acid dehydrogenase YdfG